MEMRHAVGVTSALQDYRYLNLTTFRKNGTPVVTTVWFAQFEYGAEIRRLIYTTNSIEGYNRQLRKVTKTKGAFPTDEAARKLLFLVNRDITRKWIAPVPNWARIRNQLAIRFAGRLPM